MRLPTCFAHSAASDHSHLDDPAGERALRRRALGDRRHVVDQTHLFLRCEAQTVQNWREVDLSCSKVSLRDERAAGPNVSSWLAVQGRPAGGIDSARFQAAAH